MSDLLENLIKKWIENDCCTDNFVSEPVKENNEDLKGYISKSLKIDFKILCVNNGITMRSAIYNLVYLCIKAKNNAENIRPQ